MDKIKDRDIDFQNAIASLGFNYEDDCLFLIDSNNSLPEPQIQFHLEKAKEFNASAVYLRRQLNGSYKPQVYLFDFTNRSFADENKLADIQTKIWSSGEAPLACIFYNTEIKIIDCTKHITQEYKPEYLIKDLKLTGKVHDLYNEQFAIKVKSGIFWEQEELKNEFKFKNSAYDVLIKNIDYVSRSLKEKFLNSSNDIINKVIVQSILIKYLEERIDSEGNKLLSKKYFQKYENASTFNDVLRLGKFVDLLNDLDNPETGFNGNVFKWDEYEQRQLASLDLSILAQLLDTNKSDLSSEQLEIEFLDWRYFEFKLIPVELISRLYEEFLGEKKQEKGLYYTPSHLAKLLIDECVPLKKYKEFNLNNFKILDPACGSGIFLVIVFKRLVQIWRLKNNMNAPDINDLKSILKNIYGVDKEEQAVQLASFSLSLALCNELNPVKILDELQFDNLTEVNLIHSDFFDCRSLNNKKFDLIIGNPPFIRGAISDYSNVWEVENRKVKIPQGQIALKFLSESFKFLNKSGLVCLIIKSSGLLYNSTSNDYKKVLFSKYNAVQIFDFTALSEGKSLWDNGARVGSAAIFIKNEIPDFCKNILHLTFKRTKATKERIVFEIDDYDLHFVNRNTAINNEFIWKNNLLGGGRIKNLVEKVQGLSTLQNLLSNNDSLIEEGFEIGTKGTITPKYLYKIPFLPTKAISEEVINYDLLDSIDENIKFSKVPPEVSFLAPNLIIWENIGEKRFPIFFNEMSFSFQRRMISIKSSRDDKEFLETVYNSFNKYYSFYKFYLLATSSETLINRNNTFLLKDFKNIPFIDDSFFFSEFDFNVINDSIKFQQDFFIYGEKSKALQPIAEGDFKLVISYYGSEFSRALNISFKEGDKKFRLCSIVELENSLVATVFRYDSDNSELKFFKNLSELKIDGLSNQQISPHLSINRIVKLYPQKDVIVLVKPNQYRYWLASIAYRDADKCFSDFSNFIEE